MLVDVLPNSISKGNIYSDRLRIFGGEKPGRNIYIYKYLFFYYSILLSNIIFLSYLKKLLKYLRPY